MPRGGRPEEGMAARKTWKNQVEDEIKKIFLKKEDALN